MYVAGYDILRKPWGIIFLIVRASKSKWASTFCSLKVLNQEISKYVIPKPALFVLC